MCWKYQTQILGRSGLNSNAALFISCVTIINPNPKSPNWVGNCQSNNLNHSWRRRPRIYLELLWLHPMAWAWAWAHANTNLKMAPAQWIYIEKSYSFKWYNQLTQSQSNCCIHFYHDKMDMVNVIFFKLMLWGGHFGGSGLVFIYTTCMVQNRSRKRLGKGAVSSLVLPLFVYYKINS